MEQIQSKQKDGVIELTLITATGEKRHIGRIINRMYITKRNRKKHLLIKANAYGFNHHVLENGTTFDKVMLVEGENSYLIPVADILEYGSFLWFKTQGFEKQIFMTLEQLRQYKLNIQ